jgi:hypothetical protein
MEQAGKNVLVYRHFLARWPVSYAVTLPLAAFFRVCALTLSLRAILFLLLSLIAVQVWGV